MPALVHANITAPTYLRLVNAIPVEEKPNGLFTVSLQFVAKASDKDFIYPQFYVDAPPPVWPKGVDQNTLQTRQLYMTDHSYSFNNGMMTINASYAGVQSRFVKTRGGFVVNSVVKEGPFNRIFRGTQRTIQSGSNSYTYTPYAVTTWNRFVYNFEFAHIEGQPYPANTIVKKEQLVEIITNAAVDFELNPNFIRNPNGEAFIRSVWWNVADKNFGLVAIDAVTNDEDIEHLTPTVKVIRRRLFNASQEFTQ